MNILMIGKKSYETSSPEKNTVSQKWKILLIQITCTQKEFEIKMLEEHHDLYDQSDTFILDDVFENFRNMCLKIY